MSLRRFWGDGLLVLALLAVSVKMTYDIAAVRDLDLADESAYMYFGTLIPQRGLPAAESGPLYGLWYCGLSLLQHDPVRLVYLGWQLLVALLPAVLYVLARALGGGRAVSLLGAFAVLTSCLLQTAPYPTYLAALLLALATLAATRCRSVPWAVAFLGLGLLLAAYVRPEYAVAFLVLALAGLAAALWTLATRRPRAATGLLLPALLLAGCAALLVRFAGNPLGGGRSFVAFGQHYAAHVVSARNLPLNPWSYWETIARGDFGDAQSLAEAWHVNPGAVLWHFGLNARALPGAFVEAVAPDLDLPKWGRQALWLLLAVLASLAAAGLVRRLAAGTAGAAGAAGAAAASERRVLWPPMVMLGLLSVPTAASVLVVWPRSHYLVPLACFLAALLAPGVAALPRLRPLLQRLDSGPALLALVVILLALAPNRAHGWNVQSLVRLGARGKKSASMPVLETRRTVETLRGLGQRLRAGGTILDSSAIGRAFYAGLPRQWLDSTTKAEPFRAFLRRHDAGILILDAILESDPNYRDDPEFQEFAAGRRPTGFTLIPVSGVAVRIAVRNDLLEPARP
jgi:hypothetical protein